TGLQKEVEEIRRCFKIVGRRDELLKMLIAVRSGKHILLEGPVGVGKTLLARALAEYLCRDFVRVDGDERLDESKLLGHWDPPAVLRMGYVEEAFIPGPLTKAALSGSILFINELNRLPESAQNALLPAMDEGIIQIPHLGTLRAKEGFLIIATQNPEEDIGVYRLSEALKDRFVLVKLGYPSRDEEIEIVKTHVPEVDDRTAEISVDIVRKTREHPNILRGCSIRSSIDLAKITSLIDGGDEKWYTSALMTLPQRIETSDSSIDKESLVRDLVRSILNGYKLDFPTQRDLQRSR
ncbi:MAG: MoxR family ATPase, partial [Candidatus Korarchaeum sp.]|nr:MoxR family ATPase [Candidatus Korarchaeum sp.]MDW8036061.1 MoxR family ATPase [Candidatus Korarchaeum sp.]